MVVNSRLPLAQYMAMTKDHGLLMRSTSGGAFTELARAVLRDGGVVFGACWDERFRVVHKWTEMDDGLSEMRGSKYVVSDVSGVYGPMRKFLSDGRKVLFSGTPCQTAAIRNVFGDNPNLILCSLICMANIEPVRWEEYVRGLERSAKSKITRINQRLKIEGRKGSFFKVEFENESKNFVETLYSNRHWQNLRTRPRRVCLGCKFRKGRHGADLQIGDFWGCKKFYPEVDDSQGVSAILVYSTIGESVLQNTELTLTAVKYGQILEGNPYLEKQYVPQKRVSMLKRVVSKMLRVLLRCI